MSRVVPEPVCEFCGSRVCLKWSEVKCRHTGQTRSTYVPPKPTPKPKPEPKPEEGAGDEVEEADDDPMIGG